MRITHTLLSLLLLAVIAGPLPAQTIQWKNTSGPEGGTITSLLKASDGALIAGCAHGVYRSVDGGMTWTANRFIADSVSTIVSGEGGRIHAGTGGGLYVSNDNGTSWELTAFVGASVRIFSFGSGRLMLASVGFTLHRSTDGGATWTELSIDDQVGYPFTSMAIDRNGTIYSAGGYQVARSRDSGTTWENVLLLMTTPEFPDPPLAAIIIDTAGTILAGTYGDRIYRSTDEASSWDTQWGLGAASFLITSEGDILAGTTGRGVMRSADGGVSWKLLGLERRNVRALVEPGRGELVAGTVGRGVFASSDNGRRWSEHNSGIVETIVNALDPHTGGTTERFMLAATDGGIFRTDTRGATWTLTAFDGEPVRHLIGAGDGSIYAAGMYERGIARSTDNGSSWTRMDIPRKPIDMIGWNPHIRAVAPGAGSLLLVSVDIGNTESSLTGFHGDLYRTDDFGLTWELVLPETEINEIVHRTADIFAAGDGVHRSTDRGLTWERRGTGLPVSSVVTLLATSSGELVAATADGGLYRSGNDGLSWNQVSSFPGGRITAMLEWESRIIVGTSDNGAFSTGLDLAVWSAENTGLRNSSVLSLAPGFGGLYAGTHGSGVFTSEATTSVRAGTSAASGMELYPNPATSSASLRFTLSTPTHLRLDLVDQLGRIVRTIDDGESRMGEHEVEIDLDGLASGLYHLRMDTGIKVQVMKLVVGR